MALVQTAFAALLIINGSNFHNFVASNKKQIHENNGACWNFFVMLAPFCSAHSLSVPIFSQFLCSSQRLESFAVSITAPFQPSHILCNFILSSYFRKFTFTFSNYSQASNGSAWQTRLSTNVLQATFRPLRRATLALPSKVVAEAHLSIISTYYRLNLCKIYNEDLQRNGQ